jgi:hypothetical protein
MQFYSTSKKTPYVPPALTKLTTEQARQFVANRLNCSQQEAAAFLEALRRKLLPNEDNDAVAVRRIGLSNNCPYCGKANELYTSRPKTWLDKVCPLFCLQLVRCRSCMRRHYHPLFLSPVPKWSEKRPIQTFSSEETRKRQA